MKMGREARGGDAAAGGCRKRRRHGQRREEGRKGRGKRPDGTKGGASHGKGKQGVTGKRRRWRDKDVYCTRGVQNTGLPRWRCVGGGVPRQFGMLALVEGGPISRSPIGRRGPRRSYLNTMASWLWYTKVLEEVQTRVPTPDPTITMIWRETASRATGPVAGVWRCVMARAEKRARPGWPSTSSGADNLGPPVAPLPRNTATEGATAGCAVGPAVFFSRRRHSSPSARAAWGGCSGECLVDRAVGLPPAAKPPLGRRRSSRGGGGSGCPRPPPDPSSVAPAAAACPPFFRLCFFALVPLRVLRVAFFCPTPSPPPLLSGYTYTLRSFLSSVRVPILRTPPPCPPLSLQPLLPPPTSPTGRLSARHRPLFVCEPPCRRYTRRNGCRRRDACRRPA